jgi:hypothetical protein
MSPQSTTTALDKKLSSSTKLIWQGQPQQGLVFGTTDFFLLPFAMFFLGGTLLWWAMAPNYVHLTAAVVLTLLGAYFFLGRFLTDMWRRAKTYYGFSKDQIFILVGQELRTYDIQSFNRLVLDAAVDGRGTIVFGEPNFYMKTFGNNITNWPGVSYVPSFQRIEEVKAVYQQLEGL